MNTKNALSLSKFFERLGTPMKNVMWSWCAYAPERKRAVFTVWAHLLVNDRYVISGGPDSPEAKTLGGKEIHRVASEAMTLRDEALGVLCYVDNPDAKNWKRKGYDENELLVLRLAEEGGSIIAHVEGSLPVQDAVRGVSPVA